MQRPNAPLFEHPATFSVGVTGDGSLQALQKPGLDMIGSRVVIWDVPMLHLCGEQTINFVQRIREECCLTADDVGDVETPLHVGDW